MVGHLLTSWGYQCCLEIYFENECNDTLYESVLIEKNGIGLLNRLWEAERTVAQRRKLTDYQDQATIIQRDLQNPETE